VLGFGERRTMLDYKNLIEKGFDIVDKNGDRKPFILNPVQNQYLEFLKADYPDMEGIRENILKARREGFSSLIDGILTVDFLAKENIGTQIISHNEKETLLLFDRVNFFIDSFCEKKKIDRKWLLETDSRSFLRNNSNGSFMFIGTAGAKILGRGPTLQNIHWSEIAYYANTPVLSAEKLVVGAEQQVAMGIGKIFRESTGNMWGDFYFNECERSRKKESSYKFRFFAWFVDPDNSIEPTPLTDEEILMRERYNLTDGQVCWYREKMKEFESKALGKREYPFTPEEAFLATGTGFFDPDVLKNYKDKIAQPRKVGNLAMDGIFL
jgi:hypothetical protein